MKNTRNTILGLLQVFTGMGAVAGGIPMILQPDGSTQAMSTDLLANSPFPDFFIPGILLVTVIGIGNLAGAYLTLNHKKHIGKFAMVAGATLIIWIAVQVYFIGLSKLLQPMFFLVGVAELVLGWLIYQKEERKLGQQ
jgi:hypothetical protein